MKPKSFDPTRRDFVRQACCAAVGSTGMLSALAQLRVLGAIAADSSTVRNPTAAALPSDYKALVCLFLQGGNDGTNVIIPSDNAGYAAYAEARADLALAQSSLLPIALRKYSDGRSYALNPSVPDIQSLFVQGKVALLANVGTLIQPTTLAQYNSGNGLPLQLFSHIDQLTQWQSSISDQPFKTGWGGRLADITNALNSNNQISMSITLNGANSFQVGNTVTQYAVSAGGVVTLNNFGATGNGAALYNGVKSSMSLAQSNLFEAAFGTTGQGAIADGELLSAILKTAPVFATVFPSTQTASRLAMIAKLISVAPALGLKRQIFFVQLGGWDLHTGQLAAHPPLLSEISGAVSAFYKATGELGVANQVTTFTASDFGRTYVPNSGGTDHGWGNHQFIVGGAVQGGDIYGTMPSLTVGANDDTGRGRWIPSTSVDEYNATLATWFGVSQTNLSTVLPNIGRFAHPNLGFMG